MSDPPRSDPPVSARGSSRTAAIALTVAIVACSVYANLSFTVTRPEDYRFFPPFERGVDANENMHLSTATEYARIGEALVRGKGFADPFGQPTGPTAWMPPLLPAFLAGLLRVSGGNATFVVCVVVVGQVLVLVVTGMLILAMVRKSACQVAPGVAAAVYLAALLGHFRLAFQWTHDCWLVLLALDLLLAGCCWLRPLSGWRMAAGWGLFGGLGALVNPVVAFAWGVLSLAIGLRERAWSRLVVAAVVAGVTLTPWTVRNYLTFGRLIPVKSNLAYELYQSQCLQPDGLIRRSTFSHHLGNLTGREAGEYRNLGEIAYLDRKGNQFRQAFQADPGDYWDRAAQRFLGATLWYVPFDPREQENRPWVSAWVRVMHPLPCLALVVLILTGMTDRLPRAHAVGIGVYLAFLLPYILVSYYDRYAFPLIGVKVLLVLFAVDRMLALRPGTRGATVTPFA